LRRSSGAARYREIDTKRPAKNESRCSRFWRGFETGLPGPVVDDPWTTFPENHYRLQPYLARIGGPGFNTPSSPPTGGGQDLNHAFCFRLNIPERPKRGIQPPELGSKDGSATMLVCWSIELGGTCPLGGWELARSYLNYRKNVKISRLSGRGRGATPGDTELVVEICNRNIAIKSADLPM